MSKSVTFARISLTLPPEVLAEADRLAAELDRSRSWVIAEAIRRYGGSSSTTYTLAPPSKSVVREPHASGNVASAVAGARTERLRRDLERDPAERLGMAQDLVRLARTVHPRRARERLLAFKNPEEYHRWKTRDRAAG